MNARSLVVGIFVLAATASVAQSAREVHGSADVYSAPGVVLAWGVMRGANESRTTAVIRIAADPRVYPWLAVAGIDPFTKSEQPLQLATEVVGDIDVQIPRSRFADLPRTEVRFFDTASAAQSGMPKLMVFYLGIPDTTPEFADRTKLDAYLADRVARARISLDKRTP